MTKKNIAALGCWLVVLLPAYASAGEVSGYAFGFSIPRYTGILEENIEQQGCRVTLDADFFRQSLKPYPEGQTSYERRDVRAKMHLEEGTEPVFIDRFGVARQGDQYFKVNTEELDKTFKVVKCPD